MPADGLPTARTRIWSEVLDQQAPDAVCELFGAGGDFLASDLAHELLVRGREAWNLYGPTEPTVRPASDCVKLPGRECVSLGTPIGSAGIAVFDHDHSLCPIGVPGEICLCGDGLALGYLNRPEIVAARLIAKPYSPDRRARRLYLTGHRGGCRSDGRLEHQGRLGTQLKIRGCCIGPGEIEARLITHSGVAAVVVAGHYNSGAESARVWYVVSSAREPRGSRIARIPVAVAA